MRKMKKNTLRSLYEYMFVSNIGEAFSSIFYCMLSNICLLERKVHMCVWDLYLFNMRSQLERCLDLYERTAVTVTRGEEGMEYSIDWFGCML